MHLFINNTIKIFLKHEKTNFNFFSRLINKGTHLLYGNERIEGLDLITQLFFIYIFVII